MLGIMIVLSCLVATVVFKESFVEPEDNTIQYYRINDYIDYSRNSMDLIQAMQDLAGTFALKKAPEYYKAKFLLFETLNTIDSMMRSIVYPRNVVYVYGVCGSDLMASKSMLASILTKSLSRADLLNIMPRTYIMENKQDLDELLREFNDNKVYIMKKNIQRQEGNTLTNKLEDMMSIPDDVVCVQVVLQDPYLVNKRKINIRVYLLVVVQANADVSMYMYDDGFLYYTPDEFKVLTLEPNKTITTGYIDRRVYAENPMTLKDLSEHMNNVKDDYNLLFANMLSLMSKVAKVYSPIMTKQNSGIPGVKFLVYGCDIAPDQKLDVKLMEINKGPDLSYKDERDKGVKLSMMRETFMIAGFAPRMENRFHKL